MNTNTLLTMILIIFTRYVSTAQTDAKVHFEVESGVGISIGPTTYKYYTSSVNPFYTLQQSISRRYRLPSAFLHGTVWRQLAKQLKVGVTTGINIHYLELNTYGNYYNALTIPLQLAGNFKLLKINKKLSLESELKSGYNFQRQNFPPKIEKGGPLTSLAIVLASRGRSDHLFLIKLGYERQSDRDIFIFMPDTPTDKKEKIANSVKRKSLCLLIAIPL